MTKRRKFYWPFYVCSAWAIISCGYAVAQWLADAPNPPQWLVYAALGPFLMCWWYQGILEGADNADRESRTIRAEVRAEVARAMKGKVEKRSAVIAATAEPPGLARRGGKQ